MYRLNFLFEWLAELLDGVSLAFSFTNFVNPLWWVIVWELSRKYRCIPTVDERVAELVRKRLTQRKLRLGKDEPCLRSDRREPGNGGT